MMASVLARFAQFERRLIAQRTWDTLSVKRSQFARASAGDRSRPERRRDRKQFEEGERPHAPRRALVQPRCQARALVGSHVKHHGELPKRSRGAGGLECRGADIQDVGAANDAAAVRHESRSQ